MVIKEKIWPNITTHYFPNTGCNNFQRTTKWEIKVVARIESIGDISRI